MKKLSCLLTAALVAGVVVSGDAMAAAKKKKSKSLSTAERAEIYNWALGQCRQAHGARLHHVEVEHQYKRYRCYLG